MRDASPRRSVINARLHLEPLEPRQMLSGEGLDLVDSSATDAPTVTAAASVVAEGIAPGGTVTGELREWHKITVDFEGPQTSETAATNPFTDYRLDVTFTHTGTGKTYVVPGYYAA
ncbi:MAG: DUF5060 domain-containing protein, partial [Planctomycetota bacterium]